MSKIKTINGGYKGGPPTITSDNPPINPTNIKVKPIDAQELVDNITRWYDSGRITIDGIQIMANQLNQLWTKIK